MLQFIPAILCLAGFVTSVPTALKSRDVSTSVLEQLEFVAQYAAAAYCPSNNDSPGDKVTCEVGNCPLVETASMKTSIEFENSLITDVTGYVAVDSTNENIVVSFRGSSSVRNWLTNVDFSLDLTDLCTGCTVHQGFWRSWTEARPDILEALEAAVTANPDYSIISTGHSLGGAIATLAAADLRNRGYEAALYTYGAPQVGQEITANYISEQSGGNFRVSHQQDAVPKLPSSSLGYAHISPEYWITSENDVAVTTSDINFYEDARPWWNQIGFNIDDHKWYFNAIASCSDGFEFEKE